MMTITTKNRGLMKQLACGLVLIVLLLPHVALADSETATYSVTFTATWSNQTHPHPDFPARARFSPLIGAVHGARARYWKAGQLASPGMELMAENGIIDGLAREINADIGNRFALAVLSRPAVIPSPGSDTIASFQVSKDFPLVTLVTMLAPTPDWFTGVSGLSLLDEQGNWVKSKVVMLYPYDAGTERDSGFTLDNAPEPQHRPIYSLSGSAWFTHQPVGSFTFTRIE